MLPEERFLVIVLEKFIDYFTLSDSAYFVGREVVIKYCVIHIFFRNTDKRQILVPPCVCEASTFTCITLHYVRLWHYHNFVKFVYIPTKCFVKEFLTRRHRPFSDIEN